MERIIEQLHKEAEYHFPNKSVNVCVDFWRHVLDSEKRDVEVSYSVSIIMGHGPGEVKVFYRHRGDDPHKAFLEWCYKQKESRHYGESKSASGVQVGAN